MPCLHKLFNFPFELCVCYDHNLCVIANEHKHTLLSFHSRLSKIAIVLVYALDRIFVAAAVAVRYVHITFFVWTFFVVVYASDFSFIAIAYNWQFFLFIVIETERQPM